MFKLEFEKQQLTNLEYSLNKELVRSNRAGSFASTTIVYCNTRKYHGLLICPQPAIDGDHHVLLSSLDETVIQREAEFNLGIHKYPGEYHPKGHKYIRAFTVNPIPKHTYRVGGVILTKESLFASDDDRILNRYTLIEAHSPTKLRFKPYLAFRNIHTLSKANMFVNHNYEEIENGIKIRMYTGYSYIYMQFSKKVEYVHNPDWYYNVEYIAEQERGYEYHEDLFVPGYFEVDIEKGESIIFSAGLTEKNPSTLQRIFNNEIKKRVPRDTFEGCLINAAQQFIVKKEKSTEIIAGYPWYGSKARDTFISLPGLTLVTDEPKTFKTIIDTMLTKLSNGLFYDPSPIPSASVDTPLWFFWAMQQYNEYTKNPTKIWKDYNNKMKQILYSYRKGTDFNIHMQDNGLIYAGYNGIALTWMNAFVGGKPVTPRTGMPVEVNALWYNAICFALELAKEANDTEFIKEWENLPPLIEESFKTTFWSKEKGYLADYVNGDYKDFSVRPNMVIATSLPYRPISEQIAKLVLDVVKDQLLTPRGLRTLSPKSPDYKGIYHGNQEERDAAFHQGTVWPWLIAHFAEGYLKINGKTGLPLIKRIYEGFQEVMTEHGISTISEIYDGDPPHKPNGAISQASSVAEVLRLKKIIEKYTNIK